mgnify:CR=1 FL=1
MLFIHLHIFVLSSSILSDARRLSFQWKFCACHVTHLSTVNRAVLRSHFFYYDKTWNGKKDPFANVKTFQHSNHIFLPFGCTLWQCLSLIALTKAKPSVDWRSSNGKQFSIWNGKKITFANWYNLFFPFKLLP